MEYVINITPDARGDIQYLRPYEQRVISNGIRTFLTRDALLATGRRKHLETNALAPWELRVDHYRVFYEVDGPTVYILAVGYKDHNDLYIRGKKVEL